MKSFLRKPFTGLHRDARGATAVEYGLILAIVVLGAMAAMTYMANRVTGMWNHVRTEVDAA